MRRRLARAKRAVTARRLPPTGPNFLIIGAQKAGTRWLRHNLGAHPDVLTARSEVEYFDHNFDRGPEWYRRQFRGWSGERAIGESTPGYMSWRNQPERIAARIEEQLPSVRLFVVLREPADRALSAFLHHIERHRIAPDDDLVDYIRHQPPEEDRLQIVAAGWYATSLEPFLERFGDRVRVFLNEDIRTDATGVYRGALEHLEVEPSFVPENLHDVRYSNRQPQPDGDPLRSSARKLTGTEHEALYPYFAAEIDRLEEMIGRDLSHWRPSGGGPQASR